MHGSEIGRIRFGWPRIPRIEIFVTQDPVINAYAFGFSVPTSIVLHSGSIRYLTHDELKPSVVHEMAHISMVTHIISVYCWFLNVPNPWASLLG